MDCEKIKCVAEWPTPLNAKDLKQFIGLVSYYQRFVKGFANIAAPLYCLSEKTPYAGTKKCEQAFNPLKHHLVSAPVLNQDFILVMLMPAEMA